MIDRYCLKCGRLVKASEHGSYVYFPCRQCNDEFWDLWYKLPKVKIENGKFIKTEEHNNLIKEFHKEDYFKK